MNTTKEQSPRKPAGSARHPNVKRINTRQWVTWKGRKDFDKTVSRLSAELKRNMESHINSVFKSKAARPTDPAANAAPPQNSSRSEASRSPAEKA